jgi:hypothetical protein
VALMPTASGLTVRTVAIPAKGMGADPAGGTAASMTRGWSETYPRGLVFMAVLSVLAESYDVKTRSKSDITAVGKPALARWELRFRGMVWG